MHKKRKNSCATPKRKPSEQRVRDFETARDCAKQQNDEQQRKPKSDDAAVAQSLKIIIVHIVDHIQSIVASVNRKDRFVSAKPHTQNRGCSEQRQGVFPYLLAKVESSLFIRAVF